MARNTWPCRGCGQPFLEERTRNVHEGGCPLADPEDPAGDDGDHDGFEEPESEPEEVEPAAEHRSTPDPEPEPPDRKAVDFGSGTCRCCGADVGNTTRSGLCWGCDLAGCSPGETHCKHRSSTEV